MLEDDRLASADSQLLADQQASWYTFQTIPGWINEHDYQGHAQEREKLTILRETAPVVMSVKGINKKMATITSPIFRDTSSLSGWTDDHSHLAIIPSNTWTTNAGDLTRTMDMQLPRHPWDKVYKDGWDGKFHASHAEAKLLAFYQDFYTKHSEALAPLASAMGWDTKILNINVSGNVCMICQEIARRMYEKHQIMVNFTVQGHIVYPNCKNHYCKQEMRNGLRVFCDICRNKIDHLPTVCLDLPQRSASQFDDLVRVSALKHAPFPENVDCFYDILKAVSSIPSRGLHLYCDAMLSESELTVIVPCPHTKEFAETIDRCIVDATRDHHFDDQQLLRANARKAVLKFIKSLEITELTRAIGDLDDFPWNSAVPALCGARGAFSMGDVAHELDQLLCKSVLMFYPSLNQPFL